MRHIRKVAHLRNLSGTADMDIVPVSSRLETGMLFSGRTQPNKGEINHMSNLTGLEQKIVEMAARIRELREIEGLSVSYMANAAGVTETDYLDCEAGK